MMRRNPLGVVVGISLALSACASPVKRWDDFEQYIKKSIETPLTPAGQCEQRGGFPYGEQCYQPSYEMFGEQDCRLRGGLYYEDECLFPESDRIVIE